jgi:monoamine oxidase
MGDPERSERAMEVGVVVVGAGLAGLTAARELTGAGISCVVLEARDRVGGRLLSEAIRSEGVASGTDVTPTEGKVVEVGGQWVGPGQTRIEALARSLGVDTYPTHADGEKLIEWRGSVRRYSGTVPKLGPGTLVAVNKATKALDRMAGGVSAEEPWRAPRAAELDSQTLASWIHSHVRSSDAATLLGLATRTIWGAHPAELSLLHVLCYISAAGGLEVMLETEGGAQQDRFAGGSQLVAERLAAQLGERVMLRAPVRRIDQDAGAVTVSTDRITLRARRAIVAVPPHLAGRIAYEPALPALRDQLTQRTPVGAMIKAMAVYPEPFWRADGLDGEAISDRGPVTVTFDNSPPDGSPGVLLGFVSGPEARDMRHAAPEERRRAVIDCFVRLFGGRAASPLGYIERDWAAEPWTRGCPTSNPPPGTWTAFGPALREPVGRIHWAGTGTATRWIGYMDGAVSSGERAAAEVLAAEGAAPAPAPAAAPALTDAPEGPPPAAPAPA